MTLKGHGKFAGKLTTGSNSAQKKISEFPSSKPEGWNFKFGETGFSKTSYTAPAKNCGRGFILWHWNVRASLGENWLMVSYSAQKKICQFHSSKPEGGNFKFDGMVFSQKYIGWAKNCGTSFMISNWKAMESLGENWLMVSYSAQKKICQFRSSKPQGPNFYDGMVFLKGTLVEPKAVAGVLSYDTEGPWQVWEKTKLVVSYLAQKKSVNFVSCQILAFSPARRNFISFW